MPTPVIAGPALVAGLRATFIDTWQTTYTGLQETLGNVMQLGLPSDKFKELYAYFEHSPYPERWPRGEEIKEESMDSRGFNVVNHTWAKRIPWHYEDRQDDQTTSLYDQARSLGENFATLDERMFFQIITGSADPKLLPVVPLAPDGLAIYAAGRFGVAPGNIVAGGGVASTAAIITDFMKAVGRFGEFQDTKGQPLYPPPMLDKGYTVVFAYKNLEVFNAAFRAMLVQGTAAAPSNVILAANIKVRLWPTQRITDNDWYVFNDADSRKAVFQQLREGLKEDFATFENSDRTKDTQEEFVQWRMRSGYGVRIPYATTKVDN